MNNVETSSFNPEIEEKQGNLILGIIGAIMGALPGMLLWFLLGMIGFIAGIAGYVIAKGASFGYKTLGKKLDKKGAVITILITIVAIYFTNKFSFTYDIAKAYSENDVPVTFADVYSSFWLIMKEGGFYISFIANLVVGLLLTLWSCFSYFKALLKGDLEADNRKMITPIRVTDGSMGGSYDPAFSGYTSPSYNTSSGEEDIVYEEDMDRKAQEAVFGEE
ncbi:MAG: hypothetical protein K5662_09240 [Lachnospiraceae bacterium]|nr:hypothetical protein [Lachnospiraceae bacterium]